MDTFNLLPEHRGEMYTAVLRRLHEHLQPENYLEIGTLNGGTLALARCASIAIDPNFELQHPVVGRKRVCHLFQTTSDEFFLSIILGNYLAAPFKWRFWMGCMNTNFYCEILST